MDAFSCNAHITHFRLSFVYTIQSYRLYLHDSTIHKFELQKKSTLIVDINHNVITYPTNFTIFINLAVRRIYRHISICFILIGH